MRSESEEKKEERNGRSDASSITRTPLHAEKSPCVEAEWEREGEREENESARKRKREGERNRRYREAAHCYEKRHDYKEASSKEARLLPRASMFFSGPCARWTPFLVCERRRLVNHRRAAVHQWIPTSLGMAEGRKNLCE